MQHGIRHVALFRGGGGGAALCSEAMQLPFSLLLFVSAVDVLYRWSRGGGGAANAGLVKPAQQYRKAPVTRNFLLHGHCGVRTIFQGPSLLLCVQDQCSSTCDLDICRHLLRRLNVIPLPL